MVLKQKDTVGSVIGRWIIRVILIAWSLTILFPLIWVLYTSFKNNAEFYADVWALPKVLRFENYAYAWNTAKFSEYFANSVFTVILTLSLTVIMTSTTAYILAKYRYRWLKLVSKFYIIVMAIPGVLVLVPQYFMFLNMKLTNNLWALSLLYAVRSVPFAVFIMTGFMKSINNSLLEAAEIDGASEFKKFFSIVLPCVKPALFVTVLNNVLGTWNEYILALTFLTDESKYTVPIGLAQLQNESTYRVEYGGLFAGLVIAIIPILIVYACFQKQLQEGVKAQGGVKG